MSLEEGLRPSGDQESVASRYTEAYTSAKPVLIEYSITAMQWGVSHREIPFLVGASVLVDRGGLLIEVYSGYNITPSPKNREKEAKRCAEREAIDKSFPVNSQIIAIAIASPEVSTGDEVNKSLNVLHPCKECRGMMRDLIKEGTLSSETIIYSINMKMVDKNPKKYVKGKNEETTVGNLLALYADDTEEPVVELKPEPQPQTIVHFPQTASGIA